MAAQQHIQLLGCDAPNSCGGCCLYSSITHSALQPPTATAVDTASNHGDDDNNNGNDNADDKSTKRGSATAASSVCGGSEGYVFFNCPEGTQRFSSEANVKLTKVRCFCFTRWGRHASCAAHTATAAPTTSSPAPLLHGGCASAVMGLPGLLFTINDANVQQACFLGPSSTVHALQQQQQHTTSAEATGTHADTALSSSSRLRMRCGVEGFVAALRRHFFVHRPMTFRLLHSTAQLLRCQHATACTASSSSSSSCVDELQTWHPRDEACVLDDATCTASSPQLPSPLSSSSSSPSALRPRIEAVLQLNAHTVLLAVRVSSHAVTDCYTASNGSSSSASDEVWAYAVVTSPCGKFDVARARACGVRAGPDCARLKQGIAVLRAKTTTTAATARTHVDNGGVHDGSASSSPPQQHEEDEWVQPHEVMRDTVASRHVYVTLVLDGDDVADVRAAVEELLGMRHGDDDDDGDEGDTVGVLQTLLHERYPHMLCTGWPHGSTATTGIRNAHTRRTLVVRHVVHVQPRAFFHAFAATTAHNNDDNNDEAAVYTRYVHAVFGRVRRDVRLSFEPTLRFRADDLADAHDDAPSCTTAATAAATTTTITRHVFTSQLSRVYSAFPTALVHRYHLHRIAPRLFPCAMHNNNNSKDNNDDNNDDDESKKSSDSRGDKRAASTSPTQELWPYAIKLRCVPETATATWAKDDDDAASNTGTTASKSKHNDAAAVTRAAHGTAPRATASLHAGTTTLLMTYPTMRSACALLSSTFLRSVTPTAAAGDADVSCHAAQQQQQQQQREEQQQHSSSSNSGGDAAHADDDGGGALVFLGTASAVPGKYRNVSGAYCELYVAGKRHIVLLDFGEGNAGQLAALLSASEEYECNDATRPSSFLPSPLHSAATCAFVRDVTLVYISHAHADHHLGLLAFLALRYECQQQQQQQKRQEQHTQQGKDAHCADDSDKSNKAERTDAAALPRLLVVCPVEVYAYLRDAWSCTAPYASWLWQQCEFDLVHEVDPAAASSDDHDKDEQHADDAMYVAALPRLRALLDRLNAQHGGECASRWDAEVVAVDHPANAHALLLRFPPLQSHSNSSSNSSHAATVWTDRQTLLFSGDTRPCARLQRRCLRFCGTQPLFVCLHEATFGPGYEAEACAKKHSTLPEALAVARALRARATVLNHFSQRYPKLPGLTAAQLRGSVVDVHCRRRRAAAPHVRGDSVTDNNVVHDVNVVDDDEDEAQRMCFAFDLMRVDFASLLRGTAAALTPTFVRLLEEYESWGVGTTKRLRE